MSQDPVNHVLICTRAPLTSQSEFEPPKLKQICPKLALRNQAAHLYAKAHPTFTGSAQQPRGVFLIGGGSVLEHGLIQGMVGILCPLAGSAVTFRQPGWEMVGEGAEEPQHTCIRLYLATPDTITGVSEQPPSPSDRRYEIN